MPFYGDRGPLVLSPNGETAAVQRCNNADRCTVDVVDLSSGKASAPIDLPDGMFLLAVTDDHLIVRSATVVSGINTAIRNVDWTVSTLALGSPVPGYVAEDALVIVFSTSPGATEPIERVAVIDPRTGQQVGLADLPPGHNGAALWPELPDREHAVLSPDGGSFGETGSSGAESPVDVVDLRGFSVSHQVWQQPSA